MKHSPVLAIAFLTLVTSAQASDQAGAPHPCADQARAVLSAWPAAAGAWIARSADPRYGDCERAETREIGRWLERCSMPDGALRLGITLPDREERIHFAAPACEARFEQKSYEVDSKLRGALTDRALTSHLAHHSEGLVYTWSPRMPLSVQGVAEIARVARRLGVALTYGLDPSISVEQARRETAGLAIPEAAFRPIQSIDLLERGALLHFPTIYIHHAGRMQAAGVHGYKPEAVCESMLRDLVDRAALPSLRRDDGFESAWAPKLVERRVHRAADVELVRQVKLPATGYFFDPLPMRPDWVAISHFHDGMKNYLFNLTTAEAITTPGTLDSTVTPDGELYVSQQNGHFRFYRVEDLLGGKSSALFEDESFYDDYQSLGLLSSVEGKARYRLLARAAAGFSIRDYDYDLSTRAVSPAGDVKTACGGGLSLIRLSGDGRFVALAEEEGGVLIRKVSDEGECTPAFRLPDLQAGKVSFNADLAKLVFTVSVKEGEGAPAERFRTVTHLYEIASGALTSVDTEATRGFFHHYPRFLDNGDIMFMESGIFAEDGHSSKVDAMAVVRINEASKSRR